MKSGLGKDTKQGWLLAGFVATRMSRQRTPISAPNGNLIVKLKNGKRVSARVHWVQRVIVHPLPETP